VSLQSRTPGGFNWATPAGGVETHRNHHDQQQYQPASIGPLPQAEWRPPRDQHDRTQGGCFNWATPAGGVETPRRATGGLCQVRLQLGHSRRRSGDPRSLRQDGNHSQVASIGPLPQAEWRRPASPRWTSWRVPCFNWATPAGGVETFGRGEVLEAQRPGNASIGPLPQAEWRRDQLLWRRRHRLASIGPLPQAEWRPVDLESNEQGEGVLQLGHSRRRSGDALAEWLGI